MNRKELMKLFDKYGIEYRITDNAKEVEEGLRLFDEALEKIGIIIPKEIHGDLISRQAVLRLFPNGFYSGLASQIKSLPSVEPKPVCEDAISRKWVLNEIITKVENDDSLTDEQKGSLSVAKYIIRHAPPVEPERPNRTETMMVDGEPTEIDPLSYEVGYSHGQSERPKGKWIFNPKDAIELMFTKPKCSECGVESSDGGNFCSNCGAKMTKGGNSA